MKKRWMVSLMAVAMAVSMAACGKSSGGRHRECRQQRARRDHGSGSGGQRGDTGR